MTLRRLLLASGVISASLFSALPTHAQTLHLLTEDAKLSTVLTTSASSPTTPLAVTGITAGETLVAIDVRPLNQQLYALGVNATTDKATLYLVEPSNGIATAIGTASQIAFTTNGTTAVDFPDPAVVKWDMDFNASTDRPRVVAGSLNFRVNPNTGGPVDGDNGSVSAVTGTNPDGAANGGSTTVNSVAFTNNQPSSLIATAYTLDDTSRRLFIQNTPTSGTQTLGQAVTLGGSPLVFSQSSFDIPPGVNAATSNAAVTVGTAFFVAKTAASTSRVYSLNLVNAQATLLGDTGLAVRSMAIRTDLGSAVAINLAGTSLLRFSPATPGTVTTAAISGITANEVLVGIDNRPQTGQLYGLGVNGTANTGTLYLIDPFSGTLTAVGTAGSIAFVDAAAAAIDLPDPAVGYGFDFNPTVDRVRVISGNGLNFRINPNTGAPIDGDLGGAAGSVAGINPEGNQTLNGVSNNTTGATGAAFTNNIAQSLTGGVTTLYTLDSPSGSIYIQNPPNSGTQTTRVPITIGGTFPTFPALGGFDIPGSVTVAASNAVAVGEGWFVATVGAVTNLYRIDLTTGVAVSFGPVSTGATQMAGLAVFSVEPDLSVQNPPGTELVDNANTVAFGTTIAGAPGTPVTATVTLRNVGSQPLTYSTTFDFGTQFSATGNGSGVIAGSSSKVLTLTFTPTTIGAKADVIHILSNDPQIASFEIALTGTGARAISVENPTGTAVQDNASTLNFGTTFAGAPGTPVTRSFTLRNLGSKPLIYSTTFDFGTQFSATTNGSGTIPGTSSTLVTLTFKPTTTGEKTDVIHILSNDPEIASFEIALTGAGVRDISVENPTGTVVADNASTLNLGTTSLGTPITRSITVRNLGSQPLIYSTSFDVGTKFSATTNGSGSIPGTSATLVTLTFIPSAVGTVTDTLHILSNDPEIASFEIALTGTGAIAQPGDSVTVTSGPTRLNPLVNDTLGGDLTIIAVSDPLIVIQGRTLIIPSGYTGQFTYTTSNGTSLGIGIVNVSAGFATAAPKTFNGVLTDSTGKVAGWAKASVSSKGFGSIRVVVANGDATGRLRFPVGLTTVSTPSALGPITVDRKPGGISGALTVGVVLTNGVVLTGLLHAEMTAASPVIHHLELASLDPALAGGGYAITSVSSNATVRLRGILPDGNQFSASSAVTDNAAIAFFSTLRSGVRPSGVIGGDLTLANNIKTDISGELVWSKPPQGPGAVGTEFGGVNTILNASGSVYDSSIPLFSGTKALELAGGNLVADEISNRTVTDGVPAVPIGSLLSWRATDRTGTFVFTVNVPSFTRPVTGTGVYLQKSNRAVGYFSGTTEGGRVVLSPSAP